MSNTSKAKATAAVDSKELRHWSSVTGCISRLSHALKQNKMNARRQSRTVSGFQKMHTGEALSNHHALIGATQFSPWYVLISTDGAETEGVLHWRSRDVFSYPGDSKLSQSDGIKGPGTQLAAPFIRDICSPYCIFRSAGLLLNYEKTIKGRARFMHWISKVALKENLMPASWTQLLLVKAFSGFKANNLALAKASSKEIKRIKRGEPKDSDQYCWRTGGGWETPTGLRQRTTSNSFPISAVIKCLLYARSPNSISYLGILELIMFDH